MTQYKILSADVKLRVVATHKETQKEFTSFMTYSQWMTFEKNKNYNYKSYQT